MDEKIITDSKEIEKSLLDSATNPKLSELLQDYAEVGIDALSNSEFVDAIPVVKSFAAVYKGMVSIPDRLFIKKLARFLAVANHLTTEERDAWYEKYISGNARRENEIANKLIFMVDAVNDDYKAAVIGKLFRAFVKGKISTVEQFYYLTELVEKCFTGVLKNLANGIEVNDEALYRSGIKHAPPGPSGKDITEMLDRNTQLVRMGMTGRTDFDNKYRSANYTRDGQLFVNILGAD